MRIIVVTGDGEVGSGGFTTWCRNVDDGYGESGIDYVSCKIVDSCLGVGDLALCQYAVRERGRAGSIGECELWWYFDDYATITHLEYLIRFDCDGEVGDCQYSPS